MDKMFQFHEKGNLFRVWHANNSHMIIYIHSDGGSIVCSERNYPIRRGYMYFIGAAKFHYTLPDVVEEYDRSKLFLSNRMLERLLPLFPEELHADATFTPSALVCARIPQEEQANAERIFEEMMLVQEDPRLSEALLNSCFLRLLIFILRYSTEGRSGSRGAMEQAVEYINSHIGEELCIDQVCEAVHMSKFHFCRKFKEATSLTAMQYILKTRIVAAENLLQESDLSVGVISGRCGFSSESYFCRVFREDTGMTPLQYRRKQKQPE